MSNFQFGERVQVTGYLIRKQEGEKRFWEAFSYPSPKEGLFLGTRSLYNGLYRYYPNYTMDGDEGGQSFSIKEVIPSACICIKNRKPENVFLTMVQKIHEY